MKIKILLIGLALSLSAQNLQLHYELASDRQFMVTTLEMFKPDDYGATFWFVDMEYNLDGNMSLGYWELARYVNLPGIDGLSATVQFNDGVADFGGLGQVWLAGLSYPLQLGPIVLPTDVLYRRVSGSSVSDFQLTTTWFIPVLDGKLEFAGFLDIWTQDKSDEDGKDWVLLTEPQLWYIAGEHLAAGSEVEISRNFISPDIEFFPTLALRWNF